MSTSGSPLVQEVLELADALRDRVNQPRRREALLRRPVAWNTLCSAMDVVSDTSQALWSYYETAGSEQEHSKGAAYLLAYGVLHALYLQQDATFWWGKSLELPGFVDFEEPGKWALAIPELAAARKTRNDTIGHPVRRDRPKSEPISSFFIVQHSLSAHGFEFIQHNADGGTSFPFDFVSFKELIDAQMQALVRTLAAAGEALDAADNRHHEKFMDRPLTPILRRLDHSLTKLGGVSGTDRLLLPGFVEHIEKGLNELKASVVERDEPDEQWTWEFRKLARALAGLTDYGRSVHSDVDLADVFGDYVRYAVGHLMRLTQEVDDEYGRGEGRGAPK
jgi:hypothetical protein